MASTKTHGYGWIPDLPDKRDYKFSAPLKLLKALPSKVDLTSKMPPVYDQGQLGSCTSNAIVGAVEYDQILQGNKYFLPSRLFLYYNERDMEGTVNEDSGAMIRDGIKSMVDLGDCPETVWPYDIPKFAVKPSADCYAQALKNQVLVYRRINYDLNQMKGCLASGFPFIIGFTVYESFESQEVANTGQVPMPGPDEYVLGGHAVLVVGYDDSTQRFIVRNSWGEGWGLRGYFTMPYAYLTDPNLADDFWAINTVEFDSTPTNPSWFQALIAALKRLFHWT